MLQVEALLDWRTQLDTLEALRAEGEVRYEDRDLARAGDGLRARLRATPRRMIRAQRSGPITQRSLAGQRRDHLGEQPQHERVAAVGELPGAG